jgi:hypothetical protein
MPPSTIQPKKAVHPQLLFSSFDPHVDDPAHKLFQNPRAAPPPPIRQEQEQAGPIQREETRNLSTGYNLTSTEGVGGRKDTTCELSSTLLQHPKEGSSNVDLTKRRLSYTTCG